MMLLSPAARPMGSLLLLTSLCVSLSHAGVAATPNADEDPTPARILGSANPRAQLSDPNLDGEYKLMKRGGSGVEISRDKMDMVVQVMNQLCTLSWENGTKAEAILEYQYPLFSVFTNSTLSPPASSSSLQNSIPPPMISIAEQTLNNRPRSTNNSAPLLKDGAAGDPASLGVAVLLANASIGPGTGQFNGVTFAQAAEGELNYLLYQVPRSSAGAISHRADQVQLWSDFIYMVPPFLAYYGFVTNNQSLLQEAYTQISLYRDVLRDPNTGLWKHIAMGTGTSDPGLWATGNAWVAAGILRALATIMQSPFAGQMQSQTGDLRIWAAEIVAASSSRASKDGLLHNYIDNSSTFEDTAGSALMASAALRLATLNLTTSYVTFGEQIHSTIAKRYLNSSGYLTHTVSPYNFGEQADESPEGQAFVVLLQAAYDQYLAQGGTDTTSAAFRTFNPIDSSSWAITAAALVSAVVAGVFQTI